MLKPAAYSVEKCTTWSPSYLELHSTWKCSVTQHYASLLTAEKCLVLAVEKFHIRIQSQHRVLFSFRDGVRLIRLRWSCWENFLVCWSMHPSSTSYFIKVNWGYLWNCSNLILLSLYLIPLQLVLYLEECLESSLSDSFKPFLHSRCTVTLHLITHS